MTRKDYVSIASALKGADYQYGDAAPDVAATIARAIADVMAADNPRFDRARFLKACGVEG